MLVTKNSIKDHENKTPSNNKISTIKFKINKQNIIGAKTITKHISNMHRFFILRQMCKTFSTFSQQTHIHTQQTH